MSPRLLSSAGVAAVENRNNNLKLSKMKTIWYKDWQGKWVKDLSFTTQSQAEKRLSLVRKEKALNGQCEIFNT